jgi:hypothetical protein
VTGAPPSTEYENVRAVQHLNVEPRAGFGSTRTGIRAPASATHERPGQWCSIHCAWKNTHNHPEFARRLRLVFAHSTHYHANQTQLFAWLVAPAAKNTNTNTNTKYLWHSEHTHPGIDARHPQVAAVGHSVKFCTTLRIPGKRRSLPDLGVYDAKTATVISISLQPRNRCVS